jgi:glycine cleavage system H protein
MDPAQPKTIHYKRSHFVTQLPVDFRYSLSHAWIVRHDAAHWRIGLTKFATRMLGDMVDHGFELAPGDAVKPGQIVGWVEGFKAISDLYCIAQGAFAGSNPILKEKLTLVNKDCYENGWLYLVRGEPDHKCMDVHAYREVLDKTIDKILEQQKGQEIK